MQRKKIFPSWENYKNLEEQDLASKNVCTKRLDERFDKYNNTYKTMKPVHVTSRRYIAYGVEHHGKVPKFKVHNHVKI